MMRESSPSDVGIGPVDRKSQDVALQATVPSLRADVKME